MQNKGPIHSAITPAQESLLLMKMEGLSYTSFSDTGIRGGFMKLAQVAFVTSKISDKNGTEVQNFASHFMFFA